MSLKEAAQYLQTQGRGNDSRLMHVSNNELQGLQALAKAKGGSLTINPHTGLPEAGFLEDVLPVAAAGAMMFLAPEVAPFIGGGLGLGEGALATGVGMGLLSGGVSAAGQLLGSGKVDLGQTLRSGLIGGATAGAMQGFGIGAPTSNVETAVPALAATSAPISTSAPIIPGADASVITPPPPVVSGAQPVPTKDYSIYTGAQSVNPNSFNNAVTTAEDAAGYGGSINGVPNQVAGTSPYSPSPTTAPPGVDKSWWSSLSPGQKLATGLGGVAGLTLLAGSSQPKIQAPGSTSYIRPYTYSQTRNPLYGQPGQSYYTQHYTAQPTYKAAQGGLMAIGGPVERMSQANAGEGTYPQAYLDRSVYAVPSQMPTSAEVIGADYDTKTAPYSGDISRMADGGSADSGYIPTSQAVQDYNKMLSSRAAEEYLNNPMPSALMPASQRKTLAPPPAPVTETPPISQDINGLYQYYLGRQPGKDEVGQWASKINGPVTPDMAQYFQQFTGGELAKTGYKPTGPDPFLGQGATPMSGPTSPLANSGLPQYTYNAATKSYTPVVQSAPLNFNVPPPPPVANNMDMGGGGAARGGLMPYGLGGYSDGGRLLKGPGDGMSDNIPASIGHKQPARLADGEFVVPADVVSHLGNGSTDAGAKKLYAMMDKVREARTGNKKQGKQIKSEKYLPA
jgi:hypothetical protein